VDAMDGSCYRESFVHISNRNRRLLSSRRAKGVLKVAMVISGVVRVGGRVGSIGSGVVRDKWGRVGGCCTKRVEDGSGRWCRDT
jgi:hypothetical protein